MRILGVVMCLQNKMVWLIKVLDIKATSFLAPINTVPLFTVAAIPFMGLTVKLYLILKNASLGLLVPGYLGFSEPDNLDLTGIETQV